MKNATIATSRTRADSSRPLIDYRPIDAAWGDVDQLRTLRAAKARRAAATGTDTELIEMRAPKQSPRHPLRRRTSYPRLKRSRRAGSLFRLLAFGPAH